MTDDSSYYPAVKCMIAGRPKRFHHENDLKKAIRLGDIRPGSDIVYEPVQGTEQVMAARDCPLLEGMFGAEPDAPENADIAAAPPPLSTAPAATLSVTGAASPWTGPPETRPALDYRDAGEADGGEPDPPRPDTAYPDAAYPPRAAPKSGCFKRIFIALFVAIGIVYILGKFIGDDGDVSGTENVCSSDGGEVTGAEAGEADTYYIDRATNIRTGPSVSARKVGLAKRGESFDMRRASDDSKANWYQITSGKLCGRYIYSYAPVPPLSKPETLAQKVGKKQRILADTRLLEKPGGRAIGSVTAGALVSVVGYTPDGFAEIIAPGQDNLLGYVDRSAFDKPPPPALPERAGLTIYNNCSYRIRAYTRYSWRGQPWGTWSRVPPGRSLTLAQGGEKIIPSDSAVRFHAEADQPEYSDAEMNGWRPAAPLADLSLNDDGDYLLTPDCNLTPQ